MDGIEPGCHTESGCLIPPLPPVAARVLDLRDKLIRLHRLKIGPEIMRMYNPTLFDLELLAIAEDELNPQEEQPNGNGSDLDTEREG